MAQTQIVHPGDGSFPAYDRAYHFCLVKVAAESFMLERASLEYGQPPSLELDVDATLAKGMSVDLLDGVFVVWIYYTYHDILRRRIWKTALLRTTADGILKTVESSSASASTEAGTDIPLFERSEENYLFWTYSKDAADLVVNAASADASPDKKDVRRTFGFQRISFSMATTGGGTLRDLLSTQVPELGRPSADVFDGTLLSELFATGTANSTTFEASHFYIVAHRPCIATMQYCELQRMQYTASIWYESWSVSALSEWGALYDKTTSRSGITDLQQRLCDACSPFGADAADIAEEIRAYVQQCAEGIYRLVLRDEKAKTDESERLTQICAWRKKVLSSMGYDLGMATSALLLKANGIAYQNVMLTNLTSVNPLISPLSIMAKIKDICAGAMSYFDAYVLSLESRERSVSGGTPWYFSVGRMRGRLLAEAGRLRREVQQVAEASCGLEKFLLDVALRSKPGDAEGADLVSRFADVMTSWGVSWWTTLGAEGVTDETVKPLLQACSGLGDAAKSSAEAAIKNYGEEILVGAADQSANADEFIARLTSLGAGLLGLEATFGAAVAVPAPMDTSVSIVPGTRWNLLLGMAPLPVRLIKVDPRVLTLSAAARERSPAGSELLNLVAETTVVAELSTSTPTTTTVDGPSYCSDLFSVAKNALALLRVSSAAQAASTPCVPWVRLADSVAVTMSGLPEAILAVIRLKAALGCPITGIADKCASDVYPICGKRGVELTLAPKCVLDRAFLEGGEIAGERSVGTESILLTPTGSSLAKSMVALDTLAPGLARVPLRWVASDFECASVDGDPEFSSDLERLDTAIALQLGGASEIGTAFESMRSLTRGILVDRGHGGIDT